MDLRKGVCGLVSSLGRKTLLLACVFLLGACSAGSRSHAETLGASQSALDYATYTYHGGPILQPQIVPIFWGNWGDPVNSGNRDTIYQYLQNLVIYMSGSTAPQGSEPVLAQYGVRGATLGPYCEDLGNIPPVSTTRDWIINEIYNCRNVIPANTAETLYVVFTVGIVFNDLQPNACSDHFDLQNNYIARVPFDNNPCGNPVSMDRFQGNASHEIFEASTHPTASNATGWYGPGGPSDGELVDDCGSLPTSFGTVAAVHDAIQGNACYLWTTEQQPQITEVTQVIGELSEWDLFAMASDHSLVRLHGDAAQGWGQNWEGMGGIINWPPVAVAGGRGSGTLDVFVQGTDNAVWTRQSDSNGNFTSGWLSLGGPVGARINGPPSVDSPSANVIDVYAMGIDGFYYYKRWTAHGWSNWSGVNTSGVTFNGPPTAFVARNFSLSGSSNAGGRSTDGQYRASRLWSAPIGPGVFISEPSVATRAGTAVDFFGQGADWQYYHQSFTGSGWSNLQQLQGIFMGPPVGVWQSSNTLDVFGQGADSYWYHQQQLNGAWGALESTNGAGYGATSAVSPVQGLVHLAAVGGDHFAWFNTLEGTSFSGWGPLAQGPALH